MSAFATLLRRELHARRAVFLASLAIGLFVAVLPFFSGGQEVRAREIRGAAAVAVALIWPALLALGFGATCLARDLGERRIAGDFRLPASASAIWAARLLGAYLALLAAGAIVFALPAAFGLDFEGASAGLDFFASQLARPGDRGPLWMEGVLAWLPAVFALLLLAANAIGLALFAARAWSGLDLISVALAVGAGAALRQGYLLWGADEAARSTVLSLVAAAAAGLLAGSWWQVAGGRSETGRAHARAALALFVAASGAAASLMLAHFGYVRPSVEDLAESGDVALLRGDLAALAAVVPGRAPLFRFLIDRETGAALRLGPAPLPAPAQGQRGSYSFWRSGIGSIVLPAGSSDGARAAWIVREKAGFGHFEHRVHLLDRDSRVLRARPTAVAWPTPPIAWALSPDGRAVATRWSGPSGTEPTTRIVVEDPETGGTSRVFDVVECPGFGPLAFLSGERLRVTCGPGAYSSDGWIPHLELRDIHLPSGTQLQTHGWLGEHWLAWSSSSVLALRAPGWRLERHLEGPDRRQAGWDLLPSGTGAAPRHFAEWHDPYKGPWPTDGQAIGSERILLVLERPPQFTWTRTGGRLNPLLTRAGAIEVLLLSLSGESLERFELDQPLSRILSVDPTGAAAVLVGNRGKWNPSGGFSPLAARLDLTTGEVEPLSPSALQLPDAAPLRPARATRQPDGNWLVKLPGRGTELLFHRYPPPAPPPQGPRSTGQVETPLRRR